MLDAVARRSRFVRPERVVSAASIFWAFMVTLGAQPMEYVSDVLRTLNAQHGLALRYKPFWNRLAQPAFCRFMKAMFAILALPRSRGRRSYAALTSVQYINSNSTGLR
jgi:hypothetical protein